jgi:hypothetical protein
MVAGSVSCEKDTPQTSVTQPLGKKGGRGNNTGGSGSTIDRDSLLAACGIVLADTGQSYPTVQLNNLRWRKQTGYSYDQSTGGYTYPYDILIIEFDSASIPGKVANCYMLFADHCQTRVVCNRMNGLAVSQVTTCNGTTRIFLPIGVSWLNPYEPLYTGYIYVGTEGGCIYLSQRFTFEPPRILQL